MKVLTVLGHAQRSRYFESALVELRTRGVDVALATTCRRGPLHDRLDALGVPAAVLHPAALRRADIVHAHEPLAALVLAGAKPLRLFHRHHGTSSGRLQMVSRLATRLADGVLAVSAFGARSAIRLEGADPARVRAVLNGVDVPVIDGVAGAHIRARLGLGRGDVLVVVVARLRKEKGHELLFDALDRLPSASVHVLLVGDGPEAERARARAAEVSVPIHFSGHQVDPWPWYAAADLCVVPSRRESFGLAAVEAMGAGRAVVATNVGGLPEVITNGIDGIVVPDGDPDALAHAIAMLAADPGRRAELGAEARARHVSSLTVAAMVDRWLNAYDELAAARR